MTIEEIRTFMIQWNNKFPIDRWFRQKHGIAFLSPEHRECSFIAQLMEYEEDKLYNKLLKEQISQEKDPYIPNIGEWLEREDSTEIGDYDIEEFRKEAELMSALDD